MTASIVQSGSQLTVIGTEQVLGTSITAPGAYALDIDLSPMQPGDSIELRVKRKIKSGGSFVTYMNVPYSNIQATPNLMSIPVLSAVEMEYTIKATAGTARTYDWSFIAA